jgi:hypothetical protein
LTPPFVKPLPRLVDRREDLEQLRQLGLRDGILNRNSLGHHQAQRSRCATTKAASSRIDTDRFRLDFPSLAEAIEDMNGILSATIDVIDGW